MFTYGGSNKQSRGVVKHDGLNEGRTLLTIVNHGLFQGMPITDNGTDRTPTSEHTEHG